MTIIGLISAVLFGCGKTAAPETTTESTATTMSAKEMLEMATAEPATNKTTEAATEATTKYPEGTTKITVTGGNEEEGDFIEINYYPDAKMNSYKDEYWGYDDYGYKTYTEPGHSYMVGVDLSGYVTDVDWAAVKATGVDYVIIRLGYRGYGTGVLVLDDMFDSHIRGALGAGLKVSVYFFSQALNEEEAIEEANFCLGYISAYEISMPVYFDTEKIKNDTARTDDMTKDDYTKACVAFCETIKAAGYTPGVYANQVWFTSMLDLKQVEDYNIWFAKYREVPDYPYKFDCWQYSESGIIEGVDGAIDLNVWVE